MTDRPPDDRDVIAHLMETAAVAREVLRFAGSGCPFGKALSVLLQDALSCYSQALRGGDGRLFADAHAAAGRMRSRVNGPGQPKADPALIDTVEEQLAKWKHEPPPVCRTTTDH